LPTQVNIRLTAVELKFLSALSEYFYPPLDFDEVSTGTVHGDLVMLLDTLWVHQIRGERKSLGGAHVRRGIEEARNFCDWRADYASEQWKNVVKTFQALQMELSGRTS